MTYQPDPTVHTNPDYEQRCVYCHPEILEAREKAKAEAARKELDRRAEVANWGGPVSYVTYDPRDGAYALLEAQQRQHSARQAMALQQQHAQAMQRFGIYDTLLGGFRK